jgi:hypothetical protein
MIIYNITTQVLWAIHDQWMNWFRNEYLPAILATGLFSHYQLTRLLEVNEDEGPTYAVQLYTGSLELFYNFREEYAEDFENIQRETWGNNVYSFPSLMEVIN